MEGQIGKVNLVGGPDEAQSGEWGLDSHRQNVKENVKNVMSLLVESWWVWEGCSSPTGEYFSKPDIQSEGNT